jgi:hypothetical protein
LALPQTPINTLSPTNLNRHIHTHSNPFQPVVSTMDDHQIILIQRQKPILNQFSPGLISF